MPVLELLYLFYRNCIKVTSLHATLTSQAIILIHRLRSALNEFVYVHRTNIHSR